ncbi:MAG: hypothetical protein H6737_17675 [Alphaproteobacteria bacterium]|nr:hypothetical protein [Alphaproteobacteria bacterium]
MSGFFGTFVMLVIAMAWSQWLTPRLAWAPRVVWAAGGLWLLTLVFAAASFTADGSMEAMTQSLTRIYYAAQVAQAVALGTFVVLLALSIYAFSKGAPKPSEET